MLVLKVIIGACSVITSVKIFRDFALKYKKRYYFWESAISFCDNFYSELKFNKSEIKKLLNYNYNSQDFKALVECYVLSKEKIQINYLSNEENLTINEFLSQVGYSDSQTQIKLTENYKEKFQKIANEKNVEYKKYYSLLSKTGFIFGLALFIMVI